MSSVINNVQKVFILIAIKEKFAHYINFEYLQLTYTISYISNLLSLRYSASIVHKYRS